MGSLMNREEKVYLYRVLVFYLFSVIFSPYLKMGNRDNFEITFIFTLLFAVLIPWAVRKAGYGENSVLNIILGLLLLVLVLDTASIVNYVIVTKGYSNLTANIIPNLKVALYAILVIAFYNFKVSRYRFSIFIEIIIPVVAALTAIIGIFQHYNFFQFNNWFTKHYISSESGKVLIGVLQESQQWSRVLGTLSNPNFYALEIIILLTFIISNMIYSKSWGGKAVNLVISVLLFITLIFSQSRTAILALIIVSFYIMLIQAVRGGGKNIIKYLALTIGIILLTLLLIKFMNLNYLFDAIKNGADTRSVTQRLTRWKEAYNLFKIHPVIGIGPVIGTYYPAVDNEYIHILRNYGILGLIGHLAFYIYVFVKSFKDIFSWDRNTVAKQYAFGINCSIMAVLISNMTLATFYHWRNFVLLLFLCCMWAKARNE